MELAMPMSVAAAPELRCSVAMNTQNTGMPAMP